MHNFHVITLFPHVIDAYCNASILAGAQEKELFSVSYYNPMDYVEEGKRVDDKAYGGGPGMVLRAEPVLHAYADAMENKERVVSVFFSKEGRQVDTDLLHMLYEKEHIVLISGRYEGVDARVKEITDAIPVCVGDATLTGGEIPCMYLIDAFTRMIPGVLGNQDSLEQRRYASHDVYTRPQTLLYNKKEYSVPDVLVLGHHADIDRWRKKN